jgi:molybdopterin converting factor subunit 1
MNIVLKSFGICREIIGSSEQNLVLEQKISVRQFLDSLKDKFPPLADLSSILIAVNNEYADSEMLLTDRDEVALIPPVSGG